MALCLLQRYMSEKLSQEHQKTLDTLASSMYFCTAMDMKRRSAWCETTSPDSSCNTDTPCIHALKTSCLQKYLYNTLTRTSLNTHTAHTRQTTYDKSILPSPPKTTTTKTTTTITSKVCTADSFQLILLLLPECSHQDKTAKSYGENQTW